MIQDLVRQQHSYFSTGATRSYAFRRDALRRLKKALDENEPALLRALHEDLNKSEFEAYMTEIGMVREELDYALQHLRRWMKPRRVKTPLAQFCARSFCLAEPYGVALIMAPWNYPLQLCLTPLIAAVAAGNCAVVKPSAYAPATSHAVALLLRDCFDARHVCVVEGGREENARLLSEPFDYIFFTGSVEVGRFVMARASRNLTPVTLELGGKSPVIVDDTCDLALAARRIAFGKLLNAGQTCVAPDYVLVQERVKEKFIARLREAFAASYPGGDYSAMPHIVNDKHFQRLLGLLESGTVRYGGGNDPKTRWIEPTILDDVNWSSPIMQQEIFGPILPVLPYRALNDVFRTLKSRPRPLALYLFTRDKKTERAVFANLSFGGGCVNDTIIHLATTEMPFGGVGESGMGEYHGKAGFDTFTHYRSIVKKAEWPDLRMRYLPYTRLNAWLVRKFLG